MFQITIIMYRIIQVTLIYRGRNENLVSDTTKGFTIQMRLYRLDTNVFHLKVMEHTIGKSPFGMFGNLHLNINNKENKKPPIISHTFPLAVSCTLSRKQDIGFGNQGVVNTFSIY